MPVRNNTNRALYFKDCPKPLTFSPRNIIIIKRTKFACLAQPVEHAAVNRSVGGSSPSTGAILKKPQSGFFLFYSLSSNPLTLFSPCTTFACRSDGENSLFRHFVPYQGTTRNKRGIARRKIPLPNLQNTTISCAFSSPKFLWLSALFPI